jgi:RHS repeat-associated protein
VWSATYDAFGKAAVDNAATVTSNLRLPGQYFDAETNLHYNWMRYYDPEKGGYITRDPIGLDGGMNVYTYVENNPLIYIDPFGLKLCKINLPGMDKAYLDDSIAKNIRDFIDMNRKEGINITFNEAFRTNEQQQKMLKNPNATTPASPGSSLHEAGFAVDVNWSRVPNKLRKNLIENARKSGFHWGGNFTKPDPVHFYIEVPGGKKNRPGYITQAQNDFANGVQDCGCK